VLVPMGVSCACGRELAGLFPQVHFSSFKGVSQASSCHGCFVHFMRGESSGGTARGGLSELVIGEQMCERVVFMWLGEPVLVLWSGRTGHIGLHVDLQVNKLRWS
jgi:hypothetical protein